MAIFRDEDIQQLDWALLYNSPITLYYCQEILESDLSWLQEHGYHTDLFDCMNWRTEEDLHNALATQLVFPDYYGSNLDAFNDCMRDLVIPEDSGRVFVFHRYDLFAVQYPEIAWHILDIIASHSRCASLFGRRLVALVQSDDPRIAFNPVGACPVMWNRREWLNKNRGL
jgi:hypothetical protein